LPKNFFTAPSSPTRCAVTAKARAWCQRRFSDEIARIIVC
jgi:hypothetical protein